MEEGSNSKPRVWFEVEKIIGVSTAGNSRSYKVQWAPAWVNRLAHGPTKFWIYQKVVQRGMMIHGLLYY